MRLARHDPQAIAQVQGMMDRQLSHMVRLIDDLLDVARISRNKMELRRERVRLEDVIQNAIETARPLLQDAGHELTVSLPPGPTLLDGDLTRLAQVFGNLLANSAKYTKHGGKVWVTGTRQGQELSVSVRDTGIGIPPAALPRIFDMFAQVDRNLERSAGGLGIGLALVKGLVEMHGGSIRAESEGEGKGSAFTVVLPIAESPLWGGAASGSAPARSRENSPRRILVADDNADVVASMATMLRLLGDEVVIAHDGLEAVEQAERSRPELVLMDVGMPHLNGYDAVRRIRAHDWGREMTILAITGWGQESDRRQSLAAGCDGHLVKPVRLSDLEQALAQLREAKREEGAGEAGSA
jgi:CheY-like chemotaxis protein